MKIKSLINSRLLGSLFLVFFVLIGLWSTLTPLFSAPDEPASYIRGAALVRGEFIGTDIAPSETTSYWSTYVDIPQQFGVAQLVPWCFVGKPDVPACSQPLEILTPVEDPRTDMGRYPPTGYLFSGIGSLVGPSDFSVLLGRLINAAVCALLFALACRNYIVIGRSPIVILAAITPGVIFASSVISASAIEISAAICLWASLSAWLKVDSKLIHFSTIASGVLLAIARPTGPIYLLIALLLTMLASPLSETWKSFALRSRIAALAIGTATLLAAAWQFLIYSHNLGNSYVKETQLPTLLEVADQSLNDLSRKVGESIGNFGWLDTPAPNIVVWCIIFLTTLTAFRTWNFMTTNNKLALLTLPMIIFLMMTYLNWNTQKYGGNFGVQGRHLTPLIVGLPILGGSLWKPRKSTLKLFLCAWSSSVFVSAVIAMRRYSVGIKQFNFFEMFSDPIWQPMLGIVGSMVALTLALLALSVVVYNISTKEIVQSV